MQTPWYQFYGTVPAPLLCEASGSPSMVAALLLVTPELVSQQQHTTHRAYRDPYRRALLDFRAHVFVY